jgi:hypothetical protein
VRIGQQMMTKAEHSLLLMHSTCEAVLDQIKQHCLVPGGMCTLRNVNYHVSAGQFARDARVATPWAGAPRDWAPEWKDPVGVLHVRTISDIAFAFLVS